MPDASSETTPLLNPPPATPIMNTQTDGIQDSHRVPALPQPDDDNKPKPPSRFSFVGLKRDITKDRTDIPIIACCFASGLCDSSAFNAWNTFVSMQTGTAQLTSTIIISDFLFLPIVFLFALAIQLGAHTDHLTHIIRTFRSLLCLTHPSCSSSCSSYSPLYPYPYPIP